MDGVDHRGRIGSNSISIILLMKAALAAAGSGFACDLSLFLPGCMM